MQRGALMIAIACLLSLPSLGGEYKPGYKAWKTSLVRLLANPEQYNGKRVVVTGYYLAEFEGSGLYVNKESAELRDHASGIWVDFPDISTNGVRKIRRGYVTATGVFQYDPEFGGGHLGLWPSTLTQVTGFELTKREFDSLTIIDCVFLVLSGAVILYAAIARSGWGALALSFVLAVVWGLLRSVLILKDLQEYLPVGDALAPLALVFVAAMVRGFWVFVARRRPVVSRLEEATK